MAKVLLFIAVLLGIWWMRRVMSDHGGRTQSDEAEQPPKALGETVRPCAQCGVHVPESEGVIDSSGFYCSEAHRRMGPRE